MTGAPSDADDARWAPPLFNAGPWQVRPLHRAALPELQALFEANPDFFVTVGGQPPGPTEAQDEFDELPPPHLPFAQRWFAGLVAADGTLQGVLILLSDFCAPGVWHLALFFVASAWHGRGAAQQVYQGLEAWVRGQPGAAWLRLGVVHGNTRAERFWARCGFEPVRTRPMTDASGQPRTVSVLVKPLAGGALANYLALMPRDEPGSTLA
jgi:GNAT superfamily N-acetyltransferase